MKKNQFTRLLQNKTVLAALLIVLMAGTAVAGITAMKKGNSKGDPEEGQSGYAFETQEETDNGQAQLAVPQEESTENPTDGTGKQEVAQNPAGESEGRPVQSGNVDAILKETDTEEETDEETLVDAGDAVVYAPEDEEDPDQQVGAEGTALNFQDGSHIAWPVEGNVILDYSMDSTIYFPTLDQYKCNPGILIQSAVGTPVSASVRGMVTAVGSNEELGNFVVMELGGDYTILYGQLADISVSVDQMVEAGDVLGYVGEPTKYYVVEGPNLYLELRHQESPVDPLDYIR